MSCHLQHEEIIYLSKFAVISLETLNLSSFVLNCHGNTQMGLIRRIRPKAATPTGLHQGSHAKWAAPMRLPKLINGGTPSGPQT